MKWTPKLSARCASLAVLSALLCSATSPALAADLTQQDIEQAVFNALTSAPLNFSGGQLNTVPWLYPSLQSMTTGEYLVYALGWDAVYNQPDTLRDLLLALTVASSNIVFTSRSIDASVTNSFPDALDLLSTIEGHAGGIYSDLGVVQSDVYSIASQLGPLLDAVSGFDLLSGGYHDTAAGNDAVRVVAPETDDLLQTLLSSLGSSLSSLGNSIASGNGSTTNQIADLLLALDDVQNSLGQLNEAVTYGGSPEPTADGVDGLPEPEEEGLSSVAPVDIDPDNLDVDLSTSFPQSSQSKVVLWSSVTLGAQRRGGFSVTIPEGSFDLTDDAFTGPVSVMGRISRTMWWLLFYLAVYFLIRREVTYYASLAHTEGS